MEPMTKSDVAAGSDVTKPESTRSKAPDRIRLSPAHVAKVDAWIKQACEGKREFIVINRSDVVAFLVGDRPDALSSRDLQRLRTQRYDPIRHIAWLMPQLKTALGSGDAETVSALQTELRSVELAVIDQALGPRRRKHTRPTEALRDKCCDSQQILFDREFKEDE